MKNIFVLIQSNFRDESEHKPVAVSKNKDFLIKKIPDNYQEMESFIPTYAGPNGDYYEIRETDFLIKEPYEGLKLEGMTKKVFKEHVAIHVYGRGKGRRVKLFLDWCNDFNIGIGYKYMLTGYGCTKATILKDAYDILIKKDTSELMWYDSFEAQNDKGRIKVPISA